MKYYGFITVRTSSSRLEKKCLMPFGNFNTLLEHIIARCKNFGIEPVISTSSDKSDDIIEKIARYNDIRYTRGDLVNKISRWVKTANEHQISFFHTVDADDPFFDGNRMKKSLELLLSKNADIISPSKTSASGVGSEGYSIRTKILESSKFINDPNLDTEMINDFIYFDNIVSFSLKNDNLWVNTANKPRLTLDYYEDYVMMNSIVKILGNFVTSSELKSFFKKNPDWYLINHFRNIEWKKNQNSKSNLKLHDI